VKVNENGRHITLEPGERIEIRLPHRSGLVTVTTDMLWEGTGTRMRVDVESDTPRHGPADDGLSYEVTNHAPGVVYLTGQPGTAETTDPHAYANELIDNWERALEGDSGDAELQAGTDMADYLRHLTGRNE